MSGKGLGTSGPHYKRVIPYNPNIAARLVVLENYDETFELWASLASGTSGTITPPVGSTIVLDRYPDGVDGLIVRTDTVGRPVDNPARTVAGVVVTTTFDLAGTWALSGTPTAYPVALVYFVTIPRRLTDNIPQSAIVSKLEQYEADEVIYDNTASGLVAVDVQAAIDEVAGGGSSGTTNRVEIDLEFKAAYGGDTYSEFTRVGGEITQIGIWETAVKTTKLFTKTITRTSGEITSTLITDEISSDTLTTTITRTAGEITAITKVYT